MTKRENTVAPNAQYEVHMPVARSETHAYECTRLPRHQPSPWWFRPTALSPLVHGECTDWTPQRANAACMHARGAVRTCKQQVGAGRSCIALHAPQLLRRMIPDVQTAGRDGVGRRYVPTGVATNYYFLRYCNTSHLDLVLVVQQN